MTRIIVPLTIVLCCFAAFLVWRWQEGRRQRRAEKRQEREAQERWVNKIMGDPE